MAHVLLLVVLLICSASLAFGQVELPKPLPANPVVIQASRASRWTEGAYEVWILEGGCRIAQGTTCGESQDAVVWIDRNSPLDEHPGRVIAYLERGVSIELDRDGARSRLADETWFGRFQTDGAVEVHVSTVAARPEPAPPVYHRAVARHQAGLGAIQLAQFTAPTGAPGAAVPSAVPLAAPPAGAGSVGPAPGPLLPDSSVLTSARRIRMFSRGDLPVQVEWSVDPQTNQGVAIVTAGVNLIVEEAGEYGTIDVSTDRLVLWTSNVLQLDQNGETVQPNDLPLEVYMEGNIVFRQGQRVLLADRMYYDVNRRRGTVLEAEMLTPVPNYDGILRLRAAVLQQLDQSHFFSEDMFVTSSRMGKPGYRVQTSKAAFEDTERPLVDSYTGQPLVDPETGEPVVEHERLLTSQNNFLFLKDVPVFYWPSLSTDLTEPTFYLRRIKFKNDQVFGAQVLTDWNAYQLLGIKNPPRGTRWDLSFDYLGDRGFGHGTDFTYRRNEFLGIPGPAAGLVDYWGIYDDGLDVLAGRFGLKPEKRYRERLLWQHRQMLDGGYQVTAELGWISDRNFLEEYFLREWDEFKDQTTGVELKKTVDNMSWSVTADVRVNPFFTQTDWLPRADHFWLGQSLLDTLTWYEHSSAGYARFNAATEPDDPTDRGLFHYLPWETDPGSVTGEGLSVEGERLVTRQELDFPFQAGPFKVVPYALGELAHWGQDINGDDLNRVYGQVGVRTSIPFWRVNPAAEDDLLNVHGLAHKVVFDAEFSAAEANRSMNLLPLYDQLDDDSTEAFRRRFLVTTFGIPAIGAPFTFEPRQFDERSYALRSGLGGWVTSPSAEVADDLAAFRLGMHHRWQTKRGSPERRHIIDWIVLDVNATLFPNADRDNFREALGLVDYDFRWHVGDRLALTSTGAIDFFDQGPQMFTIGGYLNRPPRGNLYLGLHLLDGPFRSRILLASYSYRMSPKWISAFGMSVDFSNDNTVSQSLSVTRIGESFLISAGMAGDATRNNWGFNLAVEPRFLPKKRLGYAGGTPVPVAGAYGLE